IFSYFHFHSLQIIMWHSSSYVQATCAHFGRSGTVWNLCPLSYQCPVLHSTLVFVDLKVALSLALNLPPSPLAFDFVPVFVQVVSLSPVLSVSNDVTAIFSLLISS